MVIIKCNINLRTDDFNTLCRSIKTMADTGVILLPSFCDLVNKVPADTEVVVIKEGEKRT